MRRLLDDRRVRRMASAVVALGLVMAVIFQRQTIADAVQQLGQLSLAAIAALIILAAVDRLLRAELVRSTLPPLSLGQAELVSDIGAAASKGLPVGGPVGTVLRWQIARSAGVKPAVFAAMLIAVGVAAAFAAWGLALVSTVVDTIGRQSDGVDLAIVAVSLFVLGGAAAFWAVVLFTQLPQRFLIRRAGWLMERLVRFVPALDGANPELVVIAIRSELRRIALRPAPILLRSVALSVNGGLILWVALSAIGVGPALSFTEFARVFFVAHLLTSFAPTPGGVGFIEFGLSAALVAAGVDEVAAVAGVAIYRLATFVAPILVGTVLYLGWQRGAFRSRYSPETKVLQPSHDAVSGAGKA